MTNTRRRLTGEVTKAKMEKTVTVRVDRSYRHPLYGKVIHSSKNYLAHDLISCRPGDKVCIVESKPLSKKKRWVVAEILERPSEVELTASAVETEMEVDIETDLHQAEEGEA